MPTAGSRKRPANEGGSGSGNKDKSAKQSSKKSKKEKTADLDESSSMSAAWKCEGCDEEFADDDSKLMECEICSLHY